MNTANFSDWLESLPETKRFLVATSITFGTLAGLGAFGIMSPKQVRIVALIVFGLVFTYSVPAIVARAQPGVGGGAMGTRR